MNLLKQIFDTKGTLTTEGRILYAHAMHLSKVDDLPDELLDYVWEDDESREEIAELYELLNIKIVQKNPHPYFSSNTDENTLVSIDWTNLDAAMERILRDALAEQSTPNRAIERKMALSFKAASAVIQLTSPKKDAVCIHTITFLFSEAIDQSYWLHLKNAKGRSKGQFEIPKGSHHFQLSIEDSDQLPTGLYYWTLLANGIPITNRLYICTEQDARKMIRRS